MYSRTGISLWLGIAIAIFTFSPFSFLQAEEAIPVVRAVDAKILYGGCEVDPYEVLIRRYSLQRDVHTGGPVRLRPTVGASGGGENGINPTLACRLMKLFDALEKEQGCTLKISSGFRTYAEQERMCGPVGRTGCLAAGKTCHNYGLGVDIVGPCVEQLRAFLGKRDPSKPGAQRFGLHFPYGGPHLQCVENPIASCRPGMKGCDGRFAITPDVSGFPSVSPTAAFTQSLRQWLTPQSAQPALPAQPAIPSQPVSPSQNPLNSFNENENINEIGGVSSQINTGTISSGSSTAADRLEELAFGPKPATTTTATSVPLVVSGSDASVLTGAQQAATTPVPTWQGAISPSQLTFVSGDLSWQGGEIVSSAPVSGFQAVLITIKAALTRILYYLTPFRSSDIIHLDENSEFEAA